MNKMIKTLIHLLLALAFSLPFSHVALASPEDITMDVIDAGSDSVADVMHELEIPDAGEHGERETGKENNKHEDGKESDDNKANKEDSESAREDSEDSREAKEDAEDSKNAADEVVSPERPEPEHPEDSEDH